MLGQDGGPWPGYAKALICAGLLLVRGTNFMSDEVLSGNQFAASFS